MTSIHSLQESLQRSREETLLFSPESAVTGATGSSEEAGAATDSLIASVISRQLFSEHEDMPLVKSETSFESLSSGSRDGGANSPVEDLLLPAPVQVDATESSFSSSWDEVEQFAPPPAEVKREVLKELSSSESEDQLQEEGEERLEDGVDRLPSSRDLERISDWLRQTMNAAVDGTASMASEDALSPVADATRRVTLGLRSTQEEPSGNSLQRDYHSDLVQAATDDEHSKLESDLIEISLEVKPAGDKMTTKEMGVQAEEFTSPAGSMTSAKSLRRWQVATTSLALLLLAIVTERLLLLQSTRRPHAEMPIPFQYVSTSPDFYSNATSTFPSASLKTAAGPFPWTPFLLASVGIALMWAKVRPSPTTAPAKRQVRADPTSILTARELLAVGMRSYALGQTKRAAEVFEQVVKLRCPPADKAVASEWLGRSLYRLAKVDSCDETMRQAVLAFRRTCRLDARNATARASLGRALLVLGKVEEAIVSLEGAIFRDPCVAFAHEYLGKAQTKLGRWAEAERHLFEAIKLDVDNYTARAFLGERLHQLGRNKEARRLLLEAIAIRNDYPAAHARLAFIATEARQQEVASKHLRLAIRWRETGCVEDDLAATSESIQGASPFFALYFSLSNAVERVDVMRQAKGLYPHDQLIFVLLATALRQSGDREERYEALPELRRLEKSLVNRLRRYRNDFEARGLYILVLLALRKAKAAESQQKAFWARLGEDKTLAGKMPFTVMALIEAQTVRP